MRRFLLILFTFHLSLFTAWAQQQFTALEQQKISIETPGLFDQSEAFTIDFADSSDQSGIQNVQYSMDNGQSSAWYALDGRKLASKPTAKGVYIHGGKKIVVK